MLELGERTDRYHEEIGAYIDPNKIDILLTYGPLSKHIADKSKVNLTQHFEDKLALAKELESLSSNKDVCLIKGSRGMALEDIINELK